MKPPLFSCLSSSVANNGSLYGRFLLGPLPIDISLTVATVLRRSLLHSQATFSIVSAEIEGATHEYASLPGIQESVLEILLNLGEIVLTTSQRNFLNPNFRTNIGTAGFYFAFIKVSGPGVVTAKDINWPKGIFCVKPNTVIATLSSNETLTMRLKIRCSLNKNKQSLYEIKENKNPIKQNNWLKNSQIANRATNNTLLSMESQDLIKDTADMDRPRESKVDMSHIEKTKTGANQSIAHASINNKIEGASKGQPWSFGNSINRKLINEKEIKVYRPDNANQTLIGDSETYKYKGLFNNLDSTLRRVPKSTRDTGTNTKKNINEINQFRFFKTKETKSKRSSRQNLLIKNQSLEELLSRKSLLGSHFKRIKKKNLLISTTLSSFIQENNVFRLEKKDKQPDKTNTEELHSYSIRKQDSLKQVLKENLDITNREGIFLENNNNKTIRNENVINENQNKRNNVTFQVLEGLFNDFEDLASIKKQVLTNQESNLFHVGSSIEVTKRSTSLEHGRISAYRSSSTDLKGQKLRSSTDEGLTKQEDPSISTQSPNIPDNKKPTIKNTLSDKTTRLGQEKSIPNKEIEKSTLSLVFPKKNQQKKKHELLVMSSSYPVEKVNFLIERDDELLGYRHRIILEVWTNGSISPRQALFESIGSIIKLIYNFREPLRNNHLFKNKTI